MTPMNNDSLPFRCLRRSVYIDGDLFIRQSQTLNVKGGFQVPYSGSPLLSISGNPFVHIIPVYTFGSVVYY